MKRCNVAIALAALGGEISLILHPDWDRFIEYPMVIVFGITKVGHDQSSNRNLNLNIFFYSCLHFI